MLLPEFIIQPVAWSATLAIVAWLLLGKQKHKKMKLGWLVVGLSGSYLLSALLGWQALLLSEFVGYVGVLFAGLAVLLGVYGVFMFYEKSGSKLHPKITHDLDKLKGVLKKSRPVWLFALIGVVVGIIEPVRLQSSQQNELFLLLSQPSPSAIISLIGNVLIVLLPIMLLIICGWLIIRSLKKNSYQARLAILLWSSGAVTIAGWLLAAMATGIL